jgi:hypothetical protein
MVLKSPVEPLGSLADGVIPGMAHANGTRPRSGDPTLAASTQSPTANPRSTAQTLWPPSRRLLAFVSPS